MKNKEVILIDFDGTISPSHGFTEVPLPDTVSAIKKLYEKYTIGIYSCRFNLEICDRKDGEKVIEYLKKYEIPYDFIEYDKPLFKAIIDDRSYNPNIFSWLQIQNHLTS